MVNKTKATIYVFICIALWAMLPIAAKIGQTNLDNHQYLFYSSLVSFLCLFGATLYFKKIEHIKKYSFKEAVYVVILGLLGTYIYYLFLYLGYKKATGLEVLVIQYTWPILIALLSIFILKEKFTLQRGIAVLLGFLGVVAVLTKGNLNTIHIDNFEVITLVFFGAFSFALFSVLSKKVALEPIGVTSIYFASATVASFLSMLYFSDFTLPKSNEILPILLNGILINGFSYLFWINALKNAQASYLVPFLFIAPILSAFYLIIFFDEQVMFYYIVGLVLVVNAGLINSIKFSKC